MYDDLAARINDRGSVHGLLGVEFVSVTPDKVVLTIEVGPKVHQPYGILHGGVSALLAESAASVGGAVSVGPEKIVVGTEINCSHLRSMESGTLTATATPFRKGRSVQVWGIELTDHDGRLIGIARCSLQVLPAPAAD